MSARTAASGDGRTEFSPRSSTILSPGLVTSACRRTVRIRTSPPRSIALRLSRSAVARRSSPPSSQSGRAVDTRGCARGSSPPVARRGSCSPRSRRGGAPAGDRARAPDRGFRRAGSRRGARAHGRPRTAGSRVACSPRPCSRRLRVPLCRRRSTCDWPDRDACRGLTWSEGHALAALRLAQELDDDALRAGSLSTLALLRFNRGEEDAPELADRPTSSPSAVTTASSCGQRAGRSAMCSCGRSAPTVPERSSRLSTRRSGKRTSAAAPERSGTCPSSNYGRAAGKSPRTTPSGCSRSVSQYGTPIAPAFFPVALIALHRGEVERAAELAARGRELGEKQGRAPSGLVALAGLIEVWGGDAAAAVGWFVAAEEKADATELYEPNLRWWRADYVEALLELDRTAEPWSCWTRGRGRRRVARAWVLAQVTRCRGLVAAARGDVEQGIALSATRPEHEQVGDPFGRARALLAWAC